MRLNLFIVIWIDLFLKIHRPHRGRSIFSSLYGSERTSTSHVVAIDVVWEFRLPLFRACLFRSGFFCRWFPLFRLGRSLLFWLGRCCLYQHQTLESSAEVIAAPRQVSLKIHSLLSRFFPLLIGLGNLTKCTKKTSLLQSVKVVIWRQF